MSTFIGQAMWTPPFTSKCNVAAINEFVIYGNRLHAHPSNEMLSDQSRLLREYRVLHARPQKRSTFAWIFSQVCHTCKQLKRRKTTTNQAKNGIGWVARASATH
jgi:hypothetical protein